MIGRLSRPALAIAAIIGGASVVASHAEAAGFGGRAGGGFAGGGLRGGYVGGARGFGHYGRPGYQNGRGWGFGHGRFVDLNRYGYGRQGYGGRGVGSYGYGGLPIYGSYGFGYGGYAAIERPYDPQLGQPTVGIAPAPMLPPAIYVIGGSGRATVRKGRRVGVSVGKNDVRVVSAGQAASQVRVR
jgi:hypothetical protein